MADAVDLQTGAQGVAKGNSTSSVPALDRAMSIFDLLSDRPQDRLTLTEVARATGIHKATCSSMLATLVTHGMVDRDDDRRYALGSTFLRLGYAFTRRFPPLVLGRPELIDFVAKSGLSCAVIARDSDDMVILEMLGNPEPAHLYMRTGTRVPLVPPVGTIFKAWSGADELGDWLDQMAQEFGGDTATHEAAVAALRARGYSLGGEHDFHMDLADAVGRIEKQGGDSRILEIALIVADKIRNYNEEEGEEAEPLNSVIAPIFDSSARVAATINAYGEFGTLRKYDLPRIVPQLLSTAIRITEKSGGRLPHGFPIS